MPDELLTTRISIYDALKAVSDITTAIGGATNPRIFQEVAEQGDEFPFVLIRALPSADDSQTQSGNFVHSNLNFRIVAAVEGRRFDEIAAIAEDIFTALHLKEYPLTPAGGSVLYGRRLRPYQTTYEVGGRHYAESGGDYNFLVS